MNKEYTLNFRKVIIFSLLIIIVMLAISAYGWVKIPSGEQIPVHWGPSGEPDRYGGKAEGLLVTPGIGVFLTLLFTFLPRIDPRRANLAKSQKAYTAVWAGTLIMMLIIHSVVVAAALGSQINIGRVIPGAVGILFIVIGNYLPKTRSNFYMGIRTPWTLSSELSWQKTHRLGGRLFILMGLFLMTSVFIQSELWVWVVIGSIMVLTIGLMVYSYGVWKNDPDRQTV